MHRTGGEADGALGMLVVGLNLADRGAHIAQIVHGIEYPEYIYAIGGRHVDEFFHHIIGVMAVAQQVLATQQHL